MSGWTNHLKGLTLFWVIVAVTVMVSCTARPQVSAPVEPFSETFYAGKELNQRDIEKLEAIRTGARADHARAAGLILGRYYVINGDNKKGLEYLNNNYKETYLSRYMRFSGMLWLFDANMKAGNESEAIKYYTMIKNRKDEDPFPIIIKSYCSSEGKKIVNDAFNDCVEDKFKKKKDAAHKDAAHAEDVKSVKEPEPTAAPVIIADKVKGDKIYITGGKDVAFMQAAIAAVASKRAVFKLEMGDSLFGSIKINPEARTLTLNGTTYLFDISRTDIASEAAGFVMTEKSVTVMAVSNEYQPYVEDLVHEFKASQIPLYVINFDRGNFQNEMKAITSKNSENTKYNVLILAPEEKLLTIVPLVRYSVKNPEKVKTVIGTDSFSSRYMSDDYVGYFQRTYVFTPVYLAGNPNAQAFAKFYRDQYNEEPTLSAYIANDMIGFLKGEPESLSATDIISIDMDKAVRLVKGLRIISSKKIEMLGRQ